MKVVTKQKVIEERVPEYETGDIVCVNVNEIKRKWAVIVKEYDKGCYDAIPIECPTNKVGFNIWKISTDEIRRDCDVLHVPVKDVSDVTVTKKEEQNGIQTEPSLGRCAMDCLPDEPEYVIEQIGKRAVPKWRTR